MTPLEFAVYCLATWRISSLLVNEAGPFDIFVKIREVFGIKHKDKIPYEYPETFFTQLLSCVWCVSIWVAMVVTLLWLSIPVVAFVLSLPFAISAGAIIIDRLKSQRLA
jgi:hypothetical protein